MASTFDDWIDYIGLNNKSQKILRKKNLDTLQKLINITDDEMAELGLAISQFKTLRAGIESLRARYGTLDDGESVQSRKAASTPIQAARDHLRSLLLSDKNDNESSDEEDDNLSIKEVDDARQPRPATAVFDPRAILIVKAKEVKAVHITEFLPDSVMKRRRSGVRNFKVGQSSSTDSFVLTQENDSSYSGISIEEWGAANCRLMNFLLQSGRLLRDDIEYYLAYTAKIFDLANKFTWHSILQFDQQYREVQAEYNMVWGTYAPQLEFQLLQPKTNAPTQQRRNIAPRLQEDCRLFKARGYCTFGNDCKYRHVAADKGYMSEEAGNREMAGIGAKPKNG